jgi:pimeloyl-ACP methyl ester carboxylesterase
MLHQDWFTLAAETAYAANSIELYRLHGWSYAEELHLPNDITEAYLLERNGVYCVALRGSDEPLDWLLRNLWIKQGRTPWGTCHGGMLDAANAVFRVIRAHLSHIDAEPKRVVFCGHSLGGAAAILLAGLVVGALRKKFWGVRPEVLALGAPPACSPELARWLAREVDVTAIALPSDPVPSLRPLLSDWVTPGQKPRPMPWGCWQAWVESHRFGYWS